jgi:hypothetical protein
MKIVDAPDLGALTGEAVAQVTSDEPRPAGHERAHIT